MSAPAILPAKWACLIHRLIVATNENDVLDEFFKTGAYRPRNSEHTHVTSSPSMDISKASNFERFVFDLMDRDADEIKTLLARQVMEPVRFYDSIATIQEFGVDEVIEIGPGKVLTGFLKKIDKTLPTKMWRIKPVLMPY